MAASKSGVAKIASGKISAIIGGVNSVSARRYEMA